MPSSVIILGAKGRFGRAAQKSILRRRVGRDSLWSQLDLTRPKGCEAD